MRLGALGCAGMLVVAASLVGSGALAQGAPGTGLERAAEALGEHLPARAAARLLRKSRVRAALTEILRGWDGEADSLQVREEGGRLIVDVRIGERHRDCFRQGSGTESGEPAPSDCVERVEVTDRRTLELTADLWRAPPRPRPPASPPPLLTPEQPLPTLLRTAPPGPRLSETGGLDPALVSLLAGHDTRLAVLLAAGTTVDPLRPPLPEPPQLDRPSDGPVLLEGGRAMANLASPFGPGRMQSELPTPEFGPGWSRGGPDQGQQAPPPIAAPDPACVARYEAADASDPPRLDCWLAVTQHSLLERRGIHDKVSRLSMLANLAPTVQAVMEREVRIARAYSVGHSLWTFAWLDWAERRPARRTEALRLMTGVERRAMRQRLWRIWRAPELNHYAALATELYEHHFGQLYPWILDGDGLPARDGVPTAWLWATNWLEAVRLRPPAEVRRLWEALRPEDRGVLQAALTHPAHADEADALTRALP